MEDLRGSLGLYHAGIRSRTAVIFTITFGILLIVGVFYYTSPKAGFPGTKVINDHPEIQEGLEEMRPLIIYFSSIGCPTCLMQDRVISAVYPEYAMDVKFIYVLFTNSMEKVFEDWSVVRVPTLIFADREGKIVSRFDVDTLHG